MAKKQFRVVRMMLRAMGVRFNAYAIVGGFSLAVENAPARVIRELRKSASRVWEYDRKGYRHGTRFHFLEA
jgi:hypothetical protein